MRFNPKARIGGGRVRDVGGSSGGGRGGLGGLGGLGSGGGRSGGLPTGGLAGGGIGTLVVVVIIYVVFQLVSSGGSGGGSTATDGNQQAGTDRYADCQTGADANNSADCARKAVEVSLENYWSTTLPQQAQGVSFKPSQIITFAGSTNTGCGGANEDVGPFYCPTDQTIYLDTGFFSDILEGQLGGQGGDFVEPYVIAHEFGHHIQNLLGTMSKVKTQKGPDSDSVRLELQADCYAGMWTKGATGTTDDQGTKIFESITQTDISQAIDSAKTVGDDYIEKRSGGSVTPEEWTHGSSAERVKWFTTGYDNGSLKACDTFSARSLS